MSDKPEAPKRLVIGNLQFERLSDKEVKVFTMGERPVCVIHKADWKDIGKFFQQISKRGANL